MPFKTKKVCGFSDTHNNSLFLRMLLFFIARCCCYCSTIRKVMGGAEHRMKDFYSGHCRKHLCIAQSFYASLAHLLVLLLRPLLLRKQTNGSMFHFCSLSVKCITPKPQRACSLCALSYPNQLTPLLISAHNYEDPCT